MKLTKDLPNYEILTTANVGTALDLLNEGNENAFEALYNEQIATLEKNGFNYAYDRYLIHFFDSRYGSERASMDTISDALEDLAIKDGADLVKFENGNIGFVAYYNGTENGFEILGKSE